MAMANVVLGFDFGVKRIGVAVGQFITGTATALNLLMAQEGQPNWQEVTRLLKTWYPTDLVVGLPLSMNDNEQMTTQLARNFGRQLQEHSGRPVHYVDERLTTVAAREIIFGQGGYKALRTAAIDSVAAKILLESWLSTYAETGSFSEQDKRIF